jgi:hypothetical protein
MSTPAHQLPASPDASATSEHAPVHPHPQATGLKKFLTSHWVDQAARTTAVLAVLAAVASSQYALSISRAILAQAEATDEWNHYSAKSIKKHLTANQTEVMGALALANPQLKQQLTPIIKGTEDEGNRYERETKEIKTKAERIDREKRRHQRKGDRFQYAFVLLQAGVVLCTVSASSKKRMLWLLAVIAGVFGLLMLANGYLLLI